VGCDSLLEGLWQTNKIEIKLASGSEKNHAFCLNKNNQYSALFVMTSCCYVGAFC